MSEIDIKAINEKLERICESLQLLLDDKLQITEMAEKQGFDKYFTYYTLDNEYETHYPHVHICVPSDDKQWDGKLLRSGSSLKTIASVKLDKSDQYSPDNLSFEEIKDKGIKTNKYKKAICAWLNSNDSGKFISLENNAKRCIKSYLTNNDSYFEDEVKKLLNE